MDINKIDEAKEAIAQFKHKLYQLREVEELEEKPGEIEELWLVANGKFEFESANKTDQKSILIPAVLHEKIIELIACELEVEKNTLEGQIERI